MNTISDLLYNSIETSLQQLYRVEGNPEMLLKQHKKVYQSIVDKNPQGAKQAMYHHLEATKEEILRIVGQHKENNN
jgi:GntR family transcriptional repressor for pyruvate dehydrogenase complex